MGASRSWARTRFPGIYEGSLPGKKPDRFKAYYRIRGLGQRTKTCGSLVEARDFLGTLRDPARQEQLRRLEKGKVTLAEYLPVRIERKRQLKASTKERYRWAKVHILEGRLAHLRLRDITREDVEGWVDDLIGAGVGPGALEKAIMLLRAVFTSAVEEGKMISNPARGIQLPPHETREAFVLSPAQIADIAETVPSRHRAAIYLMGVLALRIGEVCALEVQDVDLDAKLLHVRHNSPEVNGKKVRGTPKSKAGRRSILIPGPLADVLSEHIESWVDGDDPQALVFTGSRGGELRQNAFCGRVLQPVCRQLGIVRTGVDGKVEVPRTHDLRHSASTMLDHEGMTPSEMQAVLGHASSKTTLDVYTHAVPKSMQPKMEAVGQSMVEAMAQARGDNVIEFPGEKDVG